MSGDGRELGGICSLFIGTRTKLVKNSVDKKLDLIYIENWTTVEPKKVGVDPK